MTIKVILSLPFQTLFSQAFDLEARDYLNEDDQTVVKHRSWWEFVMIIFDENPCLFMKKILCEAIVTYSVTNRQGKNNYLEIPTSNPWNVCTCDCTWVTAFVWWIIGSMRFKLLLSSIFNSSKTEIRFPVNLGITGHVATTGEVWWDVNFVRWSIK